eukprot:Skav217669  [mRNA]  locus=scaffold2919:223640:235325:+ [translate_table: standard]
MLRRSHLAQRNHVGVAGAAHLYGLSFDTPLGRPGVEGTDTGVTQASPVLGLSHEGLADADQGGFATGLTGSAFRGWIKEKLLSAITELSPGMVLCIPPAVLNHQDNLAVLHEAFAQEGPPPNWYTEKEEKECEDAIAALPGEARLLAYLALEAEKKQQMTCQRLGSPVANAPCPPWMLRAHSAHRRQQESPVQQRWRGPQCWKPWQEKVAESRAQQLLKSSLGGSRMKSKRLDEEEDKTDATLRLFQGLSRIESLTKKMQKDMGCVPDEERCRHPVPAESAERPGAAEEKDPGPGEGSASMDKDSMFSNADILLAEVEKAVDEDAKDQQSSNRVNDVEAAMQKQAEMEQSVHCEIFIELPPSQAADTLGAAAELVRVAHFVAAEPPAGSSSAPPVVQWLALQSGLLPALGGLGFKGQELARQYSRLKVSSTAGKLQQQLAEIKRRSREAQEEYEEKQAEYAAQKCLQCLCRHEASQKEFKELLDEARRTGQWLARRTPVLALMELCCMLMRVSVAPTREEAFLEPLKRAAAAVDGMDTMDIKTAAVIQLPSLREELRNLEEQRERRRPEVEAPHGEICFDGRSNR